MTREKDRDRATGIEQAEKDRDRERKCDNEKGRQAAIESRRESKEASMEVTDDGMLCCDYLINHFFLGR